MTMKPIVDGLERDYQNRVPVLRIEASTPAGQYLWNKYNLQVTPTFLFLDVQGNEQSRLTGNDLSDSSILRQKLDRMANSGG